MFPAAGVLERIDAIEPLSDAPLDRALVARLAEQAPSAARPLNVATPSFTTYAGSALSGCSRNSFPSFSITGGACALQCDHCQANILKPMIPAISPEALERTVRDMILLQDLQGFLLSGGSNRRDEMPLERFLPAIERLKHDFPHLRVAAHTALIDRRRAARLAAAGIDTAMLDVIGAPETIREVYHLDRPVEDFEASLAALCSTSLRVVPHIVLGLHYGRLLGEWNALDIVARHPVQGLVLVVVMPHLAKPGLFETPAASAVGGFFLDARRRLPATEMLLGCARPPGMHRRMVDAYAVLAGLDGIAFPADGAVELAVSIGRRVVQAHACCSIGGGSRACT